jgi:hypothetical protein
VVEQSCATLGCEPGKGVSAAFRAYEALSRQEPAREREFWDAYEIILRRGPRQEHLADAIKEQQRSDRLRELVAELGWPSSWPPRYVALWERLGGTGESARAWAQAGWTVREVLLDPQLRLPWNAPIDVRVRTTEVPMKPVEEPTR